MITRTSAASDLVDLQTSEVVRSFPSARGEWVAIGEEQDRQVVASFRGLAIETPLGTMIDGPIRIESDTAGACPARAIEQWVSVGEGSPG